MHLPHLIFIEDKNVSKVAEHFMHVSELVFWNIYHALKQMYDCQLPLTNLILACLVHHYFTASHCASLFFLSCLVAVTTKLVCHLNVHTASYMHTFALWLPLAHKTQLNCTGRPSSATSPNCSAELHNFSFMPLRILRMFGL